MIQCGLNGKTTQGSLHNSIVHYPSAVEQLKLFGEPSENKEHEDIGNTAENMRELYKKF